MKTWVTTFLALVSIPSALAASTLEVAYQDKKISLDQADLAKLPAQEVEAADHQNKHRYAGALVRDVLALLGPRLGDSLLGESLALLVRITGTHDSSAVFASLA